MKSRALLAAAVLVSVFCEGAHARGIAVDNWAPVAGGKNTLSASVDPNSVPVGPPLAGIQSLSFSTGTSIAGYDIATLSPTQGMLMTRYEWAAVGGGVEQVIIDDSEKFNAATNSFVPSGNFTVSFGYSSGTDDFGSPNGSAPAGNLPEVATLSVNGVTYKTTIAPNSLNGIGTSGAHDDSIFDFSNGKLTNGADIARGWSGGTASAPEMDPASSAGALTLLGFLAMWNGSSRKRGKSRSAI